MRKRYVVLMTTSLVLTASSAAYAAATGDIGPTQYTPKGFENSQTVDKDYRYWEEGTVVGAGSTGEALSAHRYGSWNSPYTNGVDGYNYNDAQDYVAAGDQVVSGSNMLYQSGPHGGYLTSTHRCRECHAVHRAAGKFKLLRSDTRFEACDWCHGTGAGSGYNIQMDNNDDYTTEYNVGHTMGFGVSTGKWRAPDDTYPAYAPNYWQGGFSCFDCHSPHANPARMLGYNNAGQAVGITGILNGKVYGIVNSGGDDWANRLNSANNPQRTNKPFWLSGSWLLIKNPDREIASTSTVVASGILSPAGYTTATVPFNADGTVGLPSEGNITISAGQEIPDVVTADLLEFDANTSYPVNKVAIDWNSPIGNGRTLWKRASGTGITGSFNSSSGRVADFLGLSVRRQDALNAGWELSEYYSTIPYDGAAIAAGFSNNTPCNVWSVSDFCTDCHDGNAGKHTVQAPLFSEDRALRDQGSATDSWRGNYDLAYGHDAQPRH